MAKTNTSGTLTYQAQYQAFGQQTQTSGSTLDRQKSNSKDTDPTNLVDEGFRYRDLETGIFITRDPAGFIDGPNLYTYVRQNPWTHFDPEGLDSDADVINKAFNSDPATASIAPTVAVINTSNQQVKQVGLAVANTIQAAAELTPMQNAATAITGTDAIGNKVSGTQQAMAVVGVVAPELKGASTAVKTTEEAATVINDANKATSAATKAESTAKDVASVSKGGASPVIKGQEGVDKSEAQFVAAGGDIKGKEVTFELPSGKRTRADLTGTDAQGNATAIESKNGPSAKLSPN